jgi:hypothetical protein
MNYKITPQRIEGTITIAGGKKIHIGPDAIQNKKSDISSAIFIKKLGEALKEGLFKNENAQEETIKSKK